MTAIELLITPREKDLGGFTVGRVLPYAKRRMVGPCIFLDPMGPAEFAAGTGIDVRPHPHIGLSTVTYLFEGEILHRDTLGSEQFIRPGDVNWMTAGSGIAHSERTGADERACPHPMHGMQSWIALPKSDEEHAPEFFHHPKATLPEWNAGGAHFRLVAGRAFGQEAPVKIYSPLFYVAVEMQAGSRFTLPDEYRERGLYLVDGTLRVGGTEVRARTMPVFAAGGMIEVEALAPSRLMLLGGEPLGEPRYIEWNFVSSSLDRIVQAKDDWKNRRFPLIPGDDKDFIPLPEEAPPVPVVPYP